MDEEYKKIRTQASNLKRMPDIIEETNACFESMEILPKSSDLEEGGGDGTKT